MQTITWSARTCSIAHMSGFQSHLYDLYLHILPSLKINLAIFDETWAVALIRVEDIIIIVTVYDAI